VADRSAGLVDVHLLDLVALHVELRAHTSDAVLVPDRLARFVKVHLLGLVASLVELRPDLHDAALVSGRLPGLIAVHPALEMPSFVVGKLLGRDPVLVPSRLAVPQGVVLLHIESLWRTHEHHSLGISAHDPSIVAVLVEKLRLHALPDPAAVLKSVDHVTGAICRALGRHGIRIRFVEKVPLTGHALSCRFLADRELGVAAAFVHVLAHELVAAAYELDMQHVPPASFADQLDARGEPLRFTLGQRVDTFGLPPASNVVAIVRDVRAIVGIPDRQSTHDDERQRRQHRGDPEPAAAHARGNKGTLAGIQP
jgi:hypothetical protein